MVKNLQRDANGHTDYNVIGKWYTSLQMDEEDVIWSLDHVWPAAASAGPAAPGGSQGSLPDKDETTSGVATLTSTASSNLFADLDEETSGKISQDFFNLIKGWLTLGSSWNDQNFQVDLKNYSTFIVLRWFLL